MVRPAPPKPGTAHKYATTNSIVPVAKPGTQQVINNATVQTTQPATRPTASTVANNSRTTERMSASLVTRDPAMRTRTVEVTATKSFVQILSDLGFNQRQIATLGQRLAREASFVITSAGIGQKIILTEKTEGNKRKLIAMQIPTDRYNIRISKSRIGLIEIGREIRKDAPALAKSQYYYKSGIIQTSIDALGKRLGVPDVVTAKAIRVLNSKVNTAQVKRGDKLDMLYEYTYNVAGEQTGLKLLYVNLITKGVRTEGFRFAPDGKDTGEFFDANGNSFTKSMLASPLRGRHRITSGFGYRRHPILGRRLLHTGVDFGGKRGEPVYAAGDGTIDKFGRYGGYGNFIRIKHDGIWSTAYGHMNGFARGMYRWKRVKKGELIGYVGSTGRSTGPHLHFELQRYGTAVDPLKAKLPAGGKKLIGKDLYNFRQVANHTRSLVNTHKNR